ncbi:MAG: hypothetical protein AAGE52_01285 [Myxococcota bacterium]
MAYRDDIAALSPDHHWPFEASSADIIGAATGTDTSVTYTGAAIAEDATNALLINARTDRVTIPDLATITGAQTQKAIAGWFRTSAIQTPPCRIVGDGGTTSSFAFILAFGNQVMLESFTASGVVQIFGDTPLVPNRDYHLCGIFSGNGNNNLVRFYLDGVEQLDASPADRQPDTASLPDRNATEFGDPVGTVAVGGDAVILVAPVNGFYNHWASWNSTGAELTTTQVREELFEKGALPDVTISTGTQAAMQSSLDALASTARPNAPLCIRVEDISGGGDLSLSADAITFDPLASIHVQWMGAGTLTWENASGSDASIGSTPNGGTIVFEKPVTVRVTALNASTLAPIQNARVRLEVASIEILQGLTDASGQISATFGFTGDVAVTGRARKGDGSDPFKEGPVAGTITTDGADLVALLIPDS